MAVEGAGGVNCEGLGALAETNDAGVADRSAADGPRVPDAARSSAAGSAATHCMAARTIGWTGPSGSSLVGTDGDRPRNGWPGSGTGTVDSPATGDISLGNGSAGDV